MLPAAILRCLCFPEAERTHDRIVYFALLLQTYAVYPCPSATQICTESLYKPVLMLLLPITHYYQLMLLLTITHKLLIWFFSLGPL